MKNPTPRRVSTRNYSRAEFTRERSILYGQRLLEMISIDQPLRKAHRLNVRRFNCPAREMMPALLKKG